MNARDPRHGFARDLFARLLDQRIILVGTPLDGAGAERIVAALLFLERRDQLAPVTLRINCAEADRQAALAVYDAMQAIQTPVGTLCTGTAAGGAALLLAAGAPGRRLSLPSGRILLEPTRGRFEGSSRELDLQVRRLQRLHQQLNELLARHTGQPLERIARDTDHGVWLDAEEARAYGLIDRVVGEEQAF